MSTSPENRTAPIELTFEQAYQELAQIVSRLETGNLPLSDSLALFERGQALAQYCDSQLEAAELRISQLDSDPDETMDS